jgi:hypothetical protein
MIRLIVFGFVLQVIDFIGIEEIPKKHILKRWTREARDILPAHLKHYQRDESRGKPVTYKHSTLYVLAMELVRLGDTSSEAYDKLISMFKADLAAMAPYENVRDGLALEDRVTGSVRKYTEQAGDVLPGTGDEGAAAENPLAGLSAPCKKLKKGRPSSSRERAPYEVSGKRSRFCSICKKPGHKMTTCPDRGDLPKKERKTARCSQCGVAGHRKSTCMKPMSVPNLLL